MEKAKKLNYQPLTTPKSVRLLRLYRSSKERYGFRITIQTVELSDVPAFYALSYTWGPAQLKDDEEGSEPTEDDDAHTFEIRVNEIDPANNNSVPSDSSRPGRFVTVKENLFYFLQFMMGCEDLRDKHFWIDAISIDQNQTSERSHQVGLMGEIFKAAERVVVWLGKMEPPPNVDWVLSQFVPRLSDLYKEKGDAFLRSKDIGCTDPELNKLLGEKDCETWRRSLIPVLKYIGQQSWFDRGWVFQEVLLKRSADVLVYAGSETLSWSGLNLLARIFRRTGWANDLDSYTSWPSSDPDVKGSELFEVINIIRCFNRAKGSTTARSQVDKAQRFIRFGFTNPEEFWYSCLFLTLEVLTDKKFSEDHDHIYGCLGMLTEALPDGMENPIIPDYNISVEELFIQVAAMIIQNIPLLHCLSTIQLSKGATKSKLPSWVRDWRVEKTNCRPLVCRKSRFTALEIKYGLGGWDFDASLTNKSLGPPPVITDTVLQLHGARFDSIETCFNLDFPRGSTVARLLEFCLEPREVYEQTDEPYMQAVYRTLVADCLSSSSLKNQINEIARAWLTRYISEETSFSGDDELVTEVKRLLAPITEDSAPHKWLPTNDEVNQRVKTNLSTSARYKTDVYDKEYRAVTLRRWLFKTRKGYIGLGPQLLKPGDEIFMIQRSKVPFILRKTSKEGGAHRLVGETYVHGFMHGEMMTPELVETIGPVKIV